MNKIFISLLQFITHGIMIPFILIGFICAVAFNGFKIGLGAFFAIFLHDMSKEDREDFLK